MKMRDACGPRSRISDTRVRCKPDVEMCDSTVSVSDDTTERPVQPAARPMGTTHALSRRGVKEELSSPKYVMSKHERAIGNSTPCAFECSVPESRSTRSEFQGLHAHHLAGHCSREFCNSSSSRVAYQQGDHTRSRGSAM